MFERYDIISIMVMKRLQKIKYQNGQNSQQSLEFTSKKYFIEIYHE